MATTLTAATMTVTVAENITLNGKEQGSANTKTFASINEISKRIVTVTTTEAEILKFHATDVDAGRYIIGDVRYMRFTNLDDTNFITLTFTNEDNDEVAIKVDAGSSFIWAADNDGGMVDVFNATENADSATHTAFGPLTAITADAEASTVQIEMFVASV